MVFITSSIEEQVLLELKATKHGIFSRQLCELLQGSGDYNRDGVIGIDEAWSYMSSQLSATARQNQLFHGRVISGRYNKGFAIARNPLRK
jgi:hypothetical protein